MSEFKLKNVVDTATEIWKKKYRYNNEASIADTMVRVANAIASREDADGWAECFASILVPLKFIPGGRIISNAGTARKNATMFNCYVMGQIEDSIDGIYGSVTEAAKTQQQGGGVGYDFSTIRPMGAPVRGCEAQASGPLSFMDVFDASARTIMAAGYRRAAQMAVLRCDHPDIEAFVRAKAGTGRFQMFNMSVGITDDFIKAVKADSDWDLVFGGKTYKTIRAKELWDTIMRTTYEYAEPGFLLLDRINQQNNLKAVETITATNPCVVGAMPILTKLYGNVAIKMVVDQEVEVWNGYEWTLVTPQITGYNQPIMHVELSNGSSLTCTEYHGWYLANNPTVKIETRNLKVGDILDGWTIPQDMNDQTLLPMQNIQIANIRSVGMADVVYCFNDPKRGRAMFNNIMTGNCGEQPLPPYGACLLGSINLTKFVIDPFTDNARLDINDLIRTTNIAVRLLDNVIDMSNYPLPSQAEEAKNKRRMGIGLTGLADALTMLGKKYNSITARCVASEAMSAIDITAYITSVLLAKEKGGYPISCNDYNRADTHCEKIMNCIASVVENNSERAVHSHANLFDKLHMYFTTRMPDFKLEHVLELYRTYGMRNSHLTSIAPTGTISMLAGNVSSGLEPAFAYVYTRKIRNTTEADISQVLVCDYAYQKYCEHVGGEVPIEELPDTFVNATNIDPIDHVLMQAVLQEWVDSSISKTINIPVDYPFEKFKDVYMLAYENGCKGCTTFRPSASVPGILEQVDTKATPKPSAEPLKVEHNSDDNLIGKTILPVVQTATKFKRPFRLSGSTYKLKPAEGAALFLTINDVVDETGKKRPYEIFINTKRLQDASLLAGLSRVISAVFHLDHDPSFLVEELTTIEDQNGYHFNGMYIPSLVAHIGFAIEEHIKNINGEEVSQSVVAPVTEIPANTPVVLQKTLGLLCPDCNTHSLIKSEGCFKCTNCSYSKCQ